MRWWSDGVAAWFGDFFEQGPAPMPGGFERRRWKGARVWIVEVRTEFEPLRVGIWLAGWGHEGATDGEVENQGTEFRDRVGCVGQALELPEQG
jgi:hypothetical protein